MMKFSKTNLKSGMVVETYEGDMYVLMRAGDGGLRAIRNEGFFRYSEILVELED